jgi:hypothetical protein
MTIDNSKNSWRPASWAPAEEQHSSTESVEANHYGQH